MEVSSPPPDVPFPLTSVCKNTSQKLLFSDGITPCIKYSPYPPLKNESPNLEKHDQRVLCECLSSCSSYPASCYIFVGRRSGSIETQVHGHRKAPRKTIKKHGCSVGALAVTRLLVVLGTPRCQVLREPPSCLPLEPSPGISRWPGNT